MTTSAAPPADDERRTLRAVFLTALLLYGVFLWPFAGEVPDRYLDLTRAIVEERSLTIDRFHENTSDKALRDGHYYCVAAPGPSFVGVPAYAVAWLVSGSVELGRAVVTFLVGPLAGACAAAALFVVTGLLAGGGLERAARLWVVAAYAVGTFAFPLATVLYPHALVGAFTVAAIAAVLTHGVSGGPRSAAVAGACAAAVSLCDYQCAVLGPVFAAWVVAVRPGPLAERARSLAAFAAGAAPPLLLLALYHTACFGAPWRTGYHFFGTEELRALYARGVLGFSLPTAHTLFETALGPSRGLVVFAPPVLVGAFAALTGPARRKDALALGVGLLFLLLNAARTFDWYGGYGWGPRYQAAALPFLLLPLARAPWHPWTGRALVAATVLGAAVSLTGAGTRWPSTLGAGLAEVTTFGVRAKGLGLLLGAGPEYDPADAAPLTPRLVALTTLALLLAGGASLALWRADRRARRVALALGGALVLFQALAVSGSRGREEGLRRYLREREFIALAWRYRNAENFVVASDKARALGDLDEAAELAERALELAPGDERARLRLLLARRDREGLRGLAREARDPGVRREARAAAGGP